jgi:hypothetical protein
MNIDIMFVSVQNSSYFIPAQNYCYAVILVLWQINCRKSFLLRKILIFGGVTPLDV